MVRKIVNSDKEGELFVKNVRSSTDFSLKKPMLLFVCYNDDVKATYTEIFQNDYEICFASDLDETIATLEKIKSFSVIVIDLPHYLKILSTIKQNPLYYDIPVIVAENFKDEEPISIAMASGAYDIWHKPVNKTVIYYRVKNIIQRSNRIDTKTGLYTQEAFFTQAKKVLTDNLDKKYYIIRFDIDNFKIYNHTYGIDQGDKLLKYIGQKCHEVTTFDTFFCRFEKDHFVGIVEENYFNEHKIIDYFVGLKQNFHPEYRLVIQVGIYKVEIRSLPILQMCDRALLAHSAAKTDPLLRYCYYDDKMLEHRIAEQQILDEMDEALKNEEFVVYLQPQYNQSNMHLYGAEALVRWIHPKRGMISPGLFIPVFEKNGFILKLDKYVFRQVCKMQREWLDSGINIVPISVNLSRAEVQNENLCAELVEILTEFHLSAKYVNLEITESAYLDNPAKIVAIVNELRQAGFEVEMDDFGSGYSSLNTLKEIPVDVLKLDLKFLYGDDAAARGTRILSSIIRMAHGLRMPIIAEGVETKGQAEYLLSLGCFYIQGYYFDRPMPIEEFKGRLNNVMPDSLRKKRFFQTEFSYESINYLLNDINGAVAILEYDCQRIEGIRYNETFNKLMDVQSNDYNIYQTDVKNGFDSENYKIFEAAIKRAVDKKATSECEVQTKFIPSRKRPKWIRVKFAFISQQEHLFVLCAHVEDIDSEKKKDETIENLMRDVYCMSDSLPGGAFSVLYKNGEFSIIHANEGMANMLGYSHADYMEMQRKDLFTNVHPDEKEKLKKSLADAIDSGETYLEREYHLKKRTNEYIKVRLFWKINSLPDGSKYGTAVIIDYGEQSRDFEYIEKLEKENRLLREKLNLSSDDKNYKLKRSILTSELSHLEKSENSLGEKIETIKNLTYKDSERISAKASSWEIDFVQKKLKFGLFKYSFLKDKYTFMSDSMPALFGYTREEFYRKFNDSLSMLVWKGDRERVMREIAENEKQKLPGAANDFRVQTKTGELKWVRVIVEKITDENGAEYHIGVMVDIDNEKRIIKDNDSQNLLIKAFENNIDGGILRYKIVGKRWKLEYISPKYCALLGYSVEDLTALLNEDNFAVTYPDDVDSVRKAAFNSAETGENFYLDNRLIRVDGSVMWISSIGSYYGRKDDGYFVLTSFDISKKKEEEETRFNEGNQLKALINAIPGGIAAFEIRPNKVHVQFMTNKIADLFGISAKEYKDRVEEDPVCFIFERDKEKVLDSLSSLEKTGKSFEINFRVIQQNGELAWITMTAVKTGEINGNPICLAIYQNQSESTKLMHSIMSLSEEIVIVFDKNTKELLFANNQAERFAGKKFNKNTTQAAAEFLYGHDVESVYKFYRPDVAAEQYEVTRNGRDLTVKRVMQNWNGHDAVIVFAHDISKINQESQKIYNLMNEVTGALVIFKSDEKVFWKRTFVSAKARKLLRLPENENSFANMDDLMARVHPDDVVQLSSLISHVSKTKTFMSADYRIKDFKTGEYFWVNLEVRPVQDDEEGLLFYGIYSLK